MASLVTLGSAAYNPYNDTFGRFAMQGLQMGLSLMEHNDNLAQRKSEQLQSMISESTQNLFKGVDQQMRQKELGHRIENDLFNRILDTKKMEFEQSAHQDNVAFRNSEASYRKEQDRLVNNPAALARTEALVQETQQNKLTFDDRLQALKLSNAASSIGIAQNTQELVAQGLTNEYNRETMPFRISQASMQPAMTAMEIAEKARKESVYQKNPGLYERGITADIEAKEAQAEADKALGEYRKSGGPTRDRELAKASEVTSMINGMSKLQEDAAKYGDAAKKKSLQLKSMEEDLAKGRNSEEEKKNLQKRIEEQKASIKGDTDKAGASSERLVQARKAMDTVLKLYNDELTKRGAKPLDLNNMSDDERARRYHEGINILQGSKSIDTGMMPGSQKTLSPAEAAALEARSGRGTGTSAPGAPKSRYNELDF